MASKMECAERALAALQAVLDAVGNGPHPLRDADLPCETTSVSGLPLRFRSTGSAIRIEVGGHAIGFEIARKDARSISGETASTMTWTALEKIGSSIGRVAPRQEDMEWLDERTLAPSVDCGQKTALDAALGAAEAWCIVEGVEMIRRSTFKFRLGESRSELEAPTTWEWCKDNAITVDEELLGMIGPTVERMCMILPSQAANVVTARNKKGHPPLGYVKIEQAESSRWRDAEMDAMAAMRIVSEASRLTDRHGRTLSSLFHARDIRKPEVDMSEAEPALTRMFTWPRTFPAGAEHELVRRGVEPIFASQITRDLMNADARSGHRMPSFSPRASGRYTRWYDSPPGSPGSGVSLPQSSMDMLGRIGLLFEHDGQLLPQPHFHNGIIASCLSQGGQDGDVLLGLHLERMMGWRPFSYGMIDLRGAAVFVDRATGSDGFRFQRRNAGMKAGAAVLPGIRIRDAIWIDYRAMSDNAHSITPERVPGAWRRIAFPERKLGARTMHMVRALYAMDRAYREDFDTSSWIDGNSPLGGLSHSIVVE